MHSRHTTIAVFVIVMFLMSMATPTIAPPRSVKADSSSSFYTPHEPIAIDGDSGFTAANGVTGGIGIASDPYIIEGWNVSSSACCSSVPGISINNTSAYFVIRNVYLRVWGSPGISIRMGNVANGVVQDSQSQTYRWGLILDSSRNILVSNYTVTHDMSVISSDNITFVNNSVDSIQVASSANVIITGNELLVNAYGCGACVDHSSNVTISNNHNLSCDCTGVGVYYSDHVTVTANDVQGEAGVVVLSSSLVAIMDNRISNSPYGAIILYSCSDVSVQKNQVMSFSNSLDGIVEITGCKSVDVSGNTITTTYTAYGFSLDLKVTLSNTTTIEDNTLSNSTVALDISASSDMAIDENNIQYNGQGIVMNDTMNIRAFHNNFINNKLQAEDTYSTRNVWDNGYPSGGNFWSDYTGTDNCSGPQQDTCPSPDGVGDSPYTFNNNQDNYPLMQTFQILGGPPQDFSITSNPNLITLYSGETGNSTIMVSPLNGFTDTVTLTVSTSTVNLSCSLFPTTISGGSGTSTLSCTGSTSKVEATYLATVTGTADGLSRSTGVNYAVKPTPTSTEYILSWEGYDWDGGGEETVTLNGQFIASLPATDSPQNGGAWADFSLNITSAIVHGTNTLTFTHADWDCGVSDNVQNLQITNGGSPVYGDSTPLPLSCTQSLSYTFTI